MDISEIFAQNMRSYRIAQGLSQEKLGELSGLHRTYIGGIEQKSRNVSIKSVQKVSKALGVDPVLMFLRVQHDNAENPQKESFGKDEADKRQSHRFTDPKDCTLHKGEYALCCWNNDALVFRPLNVKNEVLAEHILSVLIDADIRGDDLMECFDQVQSDLISFFEDEVAQLLPDSPSS